jgi:hypothetical protein
MQAMLAWVPSKVQPLSQKISHCDYTVVRCYFVKHEHMPLEVTIDQVGPKAAIAKKSKWFQMKDKSKICNSAHLLCCGSIACNGYMCATVARTHCDRSSL